MPAAIAILRALVALADVSPASILRTACVHDQLPNQIAVRSAAPNCCVGVRSCWPWRCCLPAAACGGGSTCAPIRPVRWCTSTTSRSARRPARSTSPTTARARFGSIKPGYETLTVNQPIPTPWYQIPPLDFVSENLVPTKIRDNRTVTFDLAPQIDRADGAAVGSGEPVAAGHAAVSRCAPAAAATLSRAADGRHDCGAAAWGGAASHRTSRRGRCRRHVRVYRSPPAG